MNGVENMTDQAIEIRTNAKLLAIKNEGSFILHLYSLKKKYYLIYYKRALNISEVIKIESLKYMDVSGRFDLTEEAY
jgi:hypothetical protein